MPMPPLCLVAPADAAYPVSLEQLYAPPERLSYKGDLACLKAPCLSVIGSRKMTDYGEHVLRLFVPTLVRAGLTLVSGLAYGVDSFCHRLAVEAGGRCAAVLGNGLNSIYPPSHAGLAEDIIETGGCLLSEFEPDEPPLPHHFLQRNRIVAGLSKITLIVEASERSGTFSTARQALEAGRDVCVVPGDITREQSAGVLRLLKEGALPVTSAADVLELYGIDPKNAILGSHKPILTGEAASLYDLISSDGISLDALERRSGLGIANLQSVLSALELEGHIYSKANQWHKIL